MAKLYEEITAQTARQIKLIMTDVDGTLLEDGDEAIPSAAKAIRELEDLGITVGLVSGRFMGKLDEMAKELDIDGPIIAENGGLAKLHVDDELFPLGYTREPAMQALDKLIELSQSFN